MYSVIQFTLGVLPHGPVVWLSLVILRIRFAGGAGYGVVNHLVMVRIACISAVGLSVECTLQKVTLDSVGEVHYQAVGQSGNFTVAQVALVRARIFLSLMLGIFFLLRHERCAGGPVT